jgi:uncharacterized repeat protein (TIGR03803 family)
MRFASALSAALLAASVPFGSVSAAPVRVVHFFGSGTDGAHPAAALIPGTHGMLYGTTGGGGSGGCGKNGSTGCGTVFSLAPDGTVTILYAFQNNGDGLDPSALVRDGAGNLYGVTNTGGDGSACDSGCGTVFKLTPDGTETILHSFQGVADGARPDGLNIDADGNLYGVTASGGFKKHDHNPNGYGTVFKITSDGTYSILYAFVGGDDGALPLGNLALDGAGNLYGTTLQGGDNLGTVFKLTPGGVRTTLHSFTGSPDGSGPEGGVIIDGAGNLYGTTASGGTASRGTVFKVDAAGTESILYFFSGPDGEVPEAGVILDGAGNLYGDTVEGGTGNCTNGCGVVFSIAPNGTETTLASLRMGSGAFPVASLFRNGHGVLFGSTTGKGMNNNGTVFRVRGP